MTAAAPIRVPEDKDAFTRFLHSFRAQLKPVGALEEYHFEVVVESAWNLRRLRQHESEILAQEGNPFLQESLGKALDRLNRYKRNLERSHNEAFKTLQTLQAAREQNEPNPEPGRDCPSPSTPSDPTTPPDRDCPRVSQPAKSVQFSRTE